MSANNLPIADSETPPQRNSALRYWLALLHTSGVGPVTCHRLLDKFSDPKALFSLPASELRQAGVPQSVAEALQKPDWSSVDQDMHWLQGKDNHLITCQDPEFPQLLIESGQPPPVLFVHGQLDTLTQLQIAIVGSRHPTRGGEQKCKGVCPPSCRAGTCDNQRPGAWHRRCSPSRCAGCRRTNYCRDGHRSRSRLSSQQPRACTPHC